MSYLVGHVAEGEDFPAEVVRRWSDYFAYLKSIESRLPDSARDFFFADWHYNKEDPKCLHDAWLESVTIEERSASGQSAMRVLSARLSLLGWQHDRRIVIRYSGLRRYSASLPSPSPAVLSGTHGDLLYDEVEMAASGLPVHHLELSSGSLLMFEFSTIEWEWTMLEGRS